MLYLYKTKDKAKIDLNMSTLRNARFISYIFIRKKDRVMVLHSYSQHHYRMLQSLLTWDLVPVLCINSSRYQPKK